MRTRNDIIALDIVHYWNGSKGNLVRKFLLSNAAASITSRVQKWKKVDNEFPLFFFSKLTRQMSHFHNKQD